MITLGMCVYDVSYYLCNPMDSLRMRVGGDDDLNYFGIRTTNFFGRIMRMQKFFGKKLIEKNRS